MNRTVASTSMNRESSRSHAVFTIHIESKTFDGGVWNVRSSQLNLVDLAGSERQKYTKTEGLRLKEASLINQSLSTLGNVIMALVDIAHGKTRHIPYRNSKLTFLLKDSLGGNAKTYIIGCVHPSSRCFGETLSTLQFASRAKMIRNKAVINEDTHGNIAGMQAEIHKLKDLLRHYQSGVIPPELTASEEGNVASGPNSKDPDKYKRYFIEAMYLRQEVVTQNELLQDKCKRLQEMLNRRDQALSQNKLILKFRENALKRCEKLVKENGEKTSDDKDEIILALKEEIGILEQRLNHHPDVIQCRLEIFNLQAELKILKNARKQENIDSNRLGELENLLQQITKEKEMKLNRRQSLLGTPQGASQTAVNVATAERNKSQISKLQAEIETLRRELAAEREQSQQMMVEKESEIVSLRTTKERLEKNIHAHQIRYQIEREYMEDTMKTITTPKKARLQGSSSFSDADDDILQVVSPDYTDERTESLMEQIKKLQEEVNFVNAQRDHLESQIVEQVQEVSRIESQKQLTQELFNNDKAAWADKEKQFSADAEILNNKIQALDEERMVLHGEVQDFRVMYEATEKRCKQLEEQVKQCNEQRQKEVGTLETKKVQMELKIKQLQRELEQSEEELVMLRQSEENCQTTLDFTQEKLHQAEEKLMEANKETDELQVKLATAEERLAQEVDKNHKLHHQLHHKGDQEKKLLESLTELEAAQTELQNLKEMITINDQELSSVKQQLADATQQTENFVTVVNEKTEVIASLTSQLSAKHEQYNEKESSAELLSKQLEEYTQANTRLVSENEQLTREKDDLVNSHVEETNTFQNDIMKLRLQIDMQQEDFDQVMQEKDELVSNLMQLNHENNQQMTRNEELLKTIQELKEENASLSKTITSLKQAFDTYMSSKSSCEEKEAEIASWKLKCEELERRSVKLLQAFDTVSQQREELVATIKDLEEQLEAKNHTVQLLEQDVQDLRLKCNQCTDEAESWKEKVTNLQDMLTRIKEATSAMTSAGKQTEAEALHIKAEMTGLTDKIEQLESEISEKNAEVTRLRETLELKQQQSEELQVTCDEISSLNSILKQEVNKLREKYGQEAKEKARLAGNRNHLERIKYLERINQERNEISHKYHQLVVEHDLLKVKHEAMKVGKRTPNKARLVDGIEKRPLGKLLSTESQMNSQICTDAGDGDDHTTPGRQCIKPRRPDSTHKQITPGRPMVKCTRPV